QHRVEIGSHACILSRQSQTTPRSKVMTSLRIRPSSADSNSSPAATSGSASHAYRASVRPSRSRYSSTRSSSSGGWARYASAIASRPWNGPTGTPRNSISASSSRPASIGPQSPLRTPALKRSTCCRRSSLRGATLLGEVLPQEREHDRVDPITVPDVGLALHALPHEARTLGVGQRPLVEGVDLELEAVVTEVQEHVPLELTCRFVGDAAPSKGRLDRETLEPRDLRAAVRDLEAHRPRSLAVGLDHEAAEVLRLGIGALDLAEQALAIERSTTAEEGLDIVVVDESVQEVDVVRSCPADRDHGASATGTRRRRRSEPVPSATPARIRRSPPIAEAVICSSRNTAPYPSAIAGTRYVTSTAYEAPAPAIRPKYRR